MRPLRIIVELDALFDTYLACVHMLDRTHTEPLIMAGYRERYHNDLSLLYNKISDKHVKDLYSKRDLPMLKFSFSTNMVNLLADRIIKSKLLGDQSPESRDIQIIFNTYPYNLTSAIVREYAIELSNVLNTKQISRIHLPPEELTPTFLKDSYSRLILARLDDWMIAQTENLKQLPIPLFTVIAPGFIKDPVGLAAEMRKKGIPTDDNNLKRYLSGTLNHIKQTLSSVIDLEFYDLSDFSMTIPSLSTLTDEENDEGNNSGE
jgi:hypothetical protein